jgi:hypothetical protein
MPTKADLIKENKSLRQEVKTLQLIKKAYELENSDGVPFDVTIAKGS